MPHHALHNFSYYDDGWVNKVTDVLFKKYSNLKELSEASIFDIGNIIREIGTFRRKSIYVT